ncbi:MAG: hypothetical protein KAT56_01370, partial [Sedimentisphaerales bacterium]|nr:hypothetical protein [Sedimentisphaerales bacterium]
HYSKGELDTRHHRSGSYSFKLVPDGGSLGFEYDKRRIRAKPGSDFQITAYVHLEDAENCRAQLSCALTDRVGRLIPGSLYNSKLISQFDQAEDGWTRLEVYVPGNFPEARFITLSLWLLQEPQWDRQEQERTRVFQKDVRALAWFDDITIYQLPRVVLRTDRPSNIFACNETAQLQVEVEGVGSLDYQVHLTVQSSDGKEILTKAWVLSGVEADTKPTVLGDLAAGLYKAKLEILSADTLVATRQLTFAKLAEPNGGPAGRGQGFGVIMMDEKGGNWNTAINMTRMLNAKLLKLPVWRRQAETGGAIFSEENFDRKLINLQKQKIEVVATFHEVPDELALKMDVGRRSLLDVLSQDVQFWRPQVAFMLAQYARQVPCWQIGGDFQEKQVWDPRIRPVIDTMRQEFDKLVSNTVLAVPLNCMYEVKRDQIGTDHVSLRIPSSISPREIPAYLEDGRNRGLEHIWVTIEHLDADKYDREQLLIDFVKRIAYAKKGGAQAIFIKHPWQQRKYNARMVTEPTELYPVFRTLADELGSTRYVGQFDIAPGMPALIFDRDGQGCLFTWNARYDPQSGKEPVQAQLYLGEAPTMIDIFGNRTKLPSHNGISQLRLTQWPVILSNVDSRIAMLRANLELSPKVIDASISRQRLRLKFVNPFNTTISGSLRFIIDERRQRNWLVDPPMLNFILRPQQKFEQEITLKFPSSELGGRKNIDALINIDADRNYNIRTSIPFEIRLFGVDVSIFTRRVNQSDLLINQVVTNDSDKEISLNSFVDLPDQDRMERAIARLQPGATVTKSYLIRDAEKWLGQIIRIGLYDPKGTKRINYHIDIN